MRPRSFVAVCMRRLLHTDIGRQCRRDRGRGARQLNESYFNKDARN